MGHWYQKYDRVPIESYWMYYKFHLHCCGNVGLSSFRSFLVLTQLLAVFLAPFLPSHFSLHERTLIHAKSPLALCFCTFFHVSALLQGKLWLSVSASFPPAILSHPLQYCTVLLPQISVMREKFRKRNLCYYLTQYQNSHN